MWGSGWHAKALIVKDSRACASLFYEECSLLIGTQARRHPETPRRAAKPFAARRKDMPRCGSLFSLSQRQPHWTISALAYHLVRVERVVCRINGGNLRVYRHGRGQMGAATLPQGRVTLEMAEVNLMARVRKR